MIRRRPGDASLGIVLKFEGLPAGGFFVQVPPTGASIPSKPWGPKVLEAWLRDVGCEDLRAFAGPTRAPSPRHISSDPPIDLRTAMALDNTTVRPRSHLAGPRGPGKVKRSTVWWSGRSEVFRAPDWRTSGIAPGAPVAANGPRPLLLPSVLPAGGPTTEPLGWNIEDFAGAGNCGWRVLGTTTGI